MINDIDNPSTVPINGDAITMRKQFPFIIIMLILAGSLLLGACASPTPSQTEAPAKPTQAPPEATPTEEPAPTATTAPSPTPEPTSTPEPIVVVDGLDREFILEEPAQRIISMAPSNTEILFAVGAGDQVVGRDSFSDYPEEAQDVTDIGGGFGELDTETILSLEPDLVLAADLTPPEHIQALEKLGILVFVVPNPTNLEGMYDNLRVVAQITGHEPESDALIEDLQARVAAVEAKVATVEERPLVFYELDGTDANAPWTSGPGTFIDTLLAQAGGTNLGNVLDGAWAQISIEELIVQDPDIILLGDYTWGGVTPEDVAARAGWGEITAVQNGAVYIFDDNLVSRPGPRMVEGLEQLAILLHPDLFQ